MSFVTKNGKTLIEVLDDLLANVKKNFGKCPSMLRKVFELVAVSVAAKYPELTWNIVGSFFFLRCDLFLLLFF